MAGFMHPGPARGSVYNFDELARQVKMDAFLAEFRQHGLIRSACEAAAINRETYAHWLQRSSEFAAACEVAKLDAKERLERELTRRAVEGQIRKKFTAKGEPVMDPETGEQYYEREYGDSLLMFRLKRLDPEYRDRVDAPPVAAGTVTLQLSPESQAAIARAYLGLPEDAPIAMLQGPTSTAPAATPDVPQEAAEDATFAPAPPVDGATPTDTETET